MENHDKELNGRIEESKVPDLIYSISQSESTGVLYLTKGRAQKALYFQKGRLVFAKSNSIDDRLGEQLLKQKKITYAQLIEAAKLITPSKRLGTILVEKGIITADELVHAVINQIKEIVFSVFPWDEGDYFFEAGHLPSKEIIILNIPTEEIIIQGINRINSWSWIRQAVGELDTYYKVKNRYDHLEGLVNLPTSFLKIIEFFISEHTVAQACEFSSLRDFETYKAIWALSVLGIIEKKAEALPIAEESELIAANEETSQKVEELNEEIQEQEPLQEIAEKELIENEKLLQNKITEESETIINQQSKIAEQIVQDSDEETPLENPTEENLEQISKQEEISFQILNSEDTQTKDYKENIYMEQPIIELSFSDLYEFTDSAQKNIEENIAKQNVLVDQTIELNENEIDVDIKIYNSKFKYIFEIIRIELGDLANEFLLATLNKVKINFPLLFDNAKFNEFGALDENTLKKNIMGNLLTDYKEGLQALLNVKLSIIEKFLEPERTQEIKNVIAQM